MSPYGPGPGEVIITRRETYDEAAVREKQNQLIEALLDAVNKGNKQQDPAKLFTSMSDGIREVIKLIVEEFREERRDYNSHLAWAMEALKAEPGLWAWFFGPSDEERRAVFQERRAIADEIHDAQLARLHDFMPLAQTVVSGTLVCLALPLIYSLAAGNGQIAPDQILRVLTSGNGAANANPAADQAERRERVA